MGNPATLKKISTQLNISISTVSRALKNHPDISENTKRKVRELATLMDYEPNALAVNLRTNKSHVLGIVVPFISNMFNDSFISAVEEGAREKGYSLIILQSNDDAIQETENMKLCKQSRVDGLFISLSSNSYFQQLYERFAEAGTPVIFFDRVPQIGEFDTVCMADEEVAMLAAHTIVKYKKKKVLALFGNADLSITRKRKEAFAKILDTEDTSCKYEIVYCLNSVSAQQTVTTALTEKQRPDHIFCMSDELLIGAMKAIHKSGLSIPKEISVLAISNGFIPGLFNPEITYIETSGYELGKLAVRRMLENLSEKTTAKSILLPSRFVEGGSL